MKDANGNIIWKQVEFSSKGKVLFTVQMCTLPEAMAQAAHLKPIDNYQINITCTYQDK